MTAGETPSFIYHIATAADWAQAQASGEYTTSTRDRTLAEEGFIHCSAAGQVAAVANMFYRGLPDLLVLVIDADRVQPEIRLDQVPRSDEPFPHIYGPLNIDAVVEPGGSSRAPTAGSASPERRTASPGMFTSRVLCCGWFRTSRRG